MASPAPSSFQHLAECPVCYQLYKQPQILQCLHVICQACVQLLLLADTSRVECPVCRERTLLESIKSDFNKELLVEAFIKDKEGRGRKLNTGGVLPGSEHSTLLKPDFCESCKKNLNVSSQCDACSIFLCFDCEKMHSHGTEHHTLKPVYSIVDSLKSDISKTIDLLESCSQVVDSELKAGEKYLENIENVWNKAAAEVDKQVTDFIYLIKNKNAVSLEGTRMSLKEFTKAPLQNKSHLNQLQRAIAKKENALRYVKAELEEENDRRTVVCQSKNCYDNIKSDTLLLEKQLNKITEAQTRTLPKVKLKPLVSQPEAIEWQVELITSEHPAIVNKEATSLPYVSLRSHEAKYCKPNVEPSLPSDTRFEGHMIRPEGKGDQNGAPVDEEISESARPAPSEDLTLNPANTQTPLTVNELENITVTTNDENGNLNTNDDAAIVSNEPCSNKCHMKTKEIDRTPSEHSRLYLFQDELWCTTNKNMLDIYNLDCVFLRSLILKQSTRLRAISHSRRRRYIFAASLDGLHLYSRHGKHLHCLSSKSFIDVKNHSYSACLCAMEHATGDVYIFEREEKLHTWFYFYQYRTVSWPMLRKISLGNYIGDVYDRLYVIYPNGIFHSRAFLVTSWYNHKIYQFHFDSGDLVSSEGNDSCWNRIYKIKNNHKFYYHDCSLLKPQIESSNELEALSEKRSTAVMDVAVNESCNLVWVLTANKLVKYRYA